VVSIDTLLDQVWLGVIVTPDSVYQAVTALRRQLGDDPKQPAYIATVPRRGYRLMAAVIRDAGAAAALAALLIGATMYLHPWAGNSPAVASPASPRSLAVLPLLDLTEAMTEAPFADGMTEVLIDRLSKIEDLKVASPASSFYYKDTQLAPAQIAQALHVAYLLEGSVRKPGTTLRVSARLVRAGDGFVL
jgi:TolB-like protein